VILYEYPLNERVRTLLASRGPLRPGAFFPGQVACHAHHACLTGMFEILESRAGRT
jgi:cell division protein ZapD